MTSNTRRSWTWAVAAAALVVSCGGETDTGGSGGTTTGGSGGTTTGGSGGTTTGGSGGTGGVGTCDALEKEYAAALADAKQCNPMMSSPQCTVLVPDELACPCDTYVSADNQLTLAKLKDLQTQWATASCVVPCPAIACVAPQGAGCIPSGAGGDAAECQDYGPD